MCPRDHVREEDAYAWYGIDDETGEPRWRSNYIVYDLIYETVARCTREGLWDEPTTTR